MANELQFVLYNIDQEDIKVKVAIKDETIWVTQRGMAELFGVNIPAISKHLTNIYEEGELLPEATVSKMEIVDLIRRVEWLEIFQETTFPSLLSTGVYVSCHCCKAPTKKEEASMECGKLTAKLDRLDMHTAIVIEP